MNWTRRWSILTRMEVSVTDAKAQLTDLVRQAEAGEDVVLTRHGQQVARLVPVRRRLPPDELAARVKELQESARAHALPGPCAARSQDFLYDEDGLPV